MNDFVELFLLDGTENLLLGCAKLSHISVGDAVDVDGEFFEVSKKFPLYLEQNGDEMAFIKELYGGLSGRDIYIVEEFYHKCSVKEETDNECSKD